MKAITLVCFACGKVGHASANGLAMVLTEHGERKPYRVCPFVGSHPWGDTVAPNDKKCGRCGFANFRYSNGHEYSSDGIRGYRCLGCGAIKPDGSSAGLRARRKQPSTEMKLEALKQGRELSVDPFALAHAEPGTYPGTDEKAVLTLAREYQRAEDSDYVSISWDNQVKAANYFNTHGLVNTLDEIVRVGGSGALS